MKCNLKVILRITLGNLGLSMSQWDTIKFSRKREVVNVKKIVALIAYEQGYSHREIGSFLRQDRTTVIHSLKTIKDEISVYAESRERVSRIRAICSDAPPHQSVHEYSGWIARSSSGILTLSNSVPKRMGGYWIAEGSKPFYPYESFPQVTYESGPVKVKVKVSIEEDEKM